MKTAKRFVPFKDLPNGSVFKVVKEVSREKRAVPGYPATVPTPPKNYFVKVSNSRSRAYSRAQTIILALNDIVEVIAYPSQKHQLLSAGH